MDLLLLDITSVRLLLIDFGTLPSRRSLERCHHSCTNTFHAGEHSVMYTRRRPAYAGSYLVPDQPVERSDAVAGVVRRELLRTVKESSPLEYTPCRGDVDHSAERANAMIRADTRSLRNRCPDSEIGGS